MRYGVQLRTLDAFADPRQTMRVAVAAEAAGWEALLVWDHLRWNAGDRDVSADPWVTLGACAAVTSRIALGPGVTPLPRHRPQALAQHLATLSLATGGRVIFGAGIGGTGSEFEVFGDAAPSAIRWTMLDEGLELVAQLLSGERVDHEGQHYTAAGVILAPLPLQPIPFWIGGNSPAALQRAARWGGWLVNGSDDLENLLSPDDVAAKLQGLRIPEVAFIGYGAEADLTAYAAAGVTWWIENLRGEPDDVLRRVALGPPRA